MSDENCASNNNVWLPSQKDDSSNSNFIASGFADEQNFFADTKKVSDNIDFSNHNLLTEISYPGEKQVYLNEASTNSEEITISGSLSTAVLPSEQLLLETSKDYLRSCELLEEFETTNQHELLDSASLESTNVMDIGLPLLSDSSVVSSLVDNTTPHSKISPLVPRTTEQIDQNCRLYVNDSNVLQEDCNVFGSSLEMECTVQDHNGNGSTRNSSRTPSTLLERVCQSLDKSCSFHNVPVSTEKKCSQLDSEDLVQSCNDAATHSNAQPVEHCEVIPEDTPFIGENQNKGVEIKETDATNEIHTDKIRSDNSEVDCDFNSNFSFNSREVIKSQSQKSQFDVCSVASIMKEIGILHVMDKRAVNENRSAVKVERDQDSVSAGSNLSIQTQITGKSGDGSSDGLWPGTLDHDYQLVQKSTIGDAGEDLITKQSGVHEQPPSKIKQDALSGHVDKQSIYLPEDKAFKTGSLQCMPSKQDAEGFINLSKISDKGSSSSQCESTLGDCDGSNSSNAFSECNYGNTDGMSVELFNDMSHPSNIMVGLDCDSNQSNIIFIDHGNFVGEQEIILSGPHGDSIDICTKSNEQEIFPSPEDNATYLGNITLEDGVSLQLPPTWSKQGSISLQDRKPTAMVHKAKPKKRKDGHLPKRNVAPQIGDRPGRHNISLTNIIFNGSVDSLGKAEELERMSLPSTDLYDCVSVVYSAYEEESTTFSKLWNPDIRLSSELFHEETDTTDGVEPDILPQQKLLSKKLKGSKSKVEKLQKTVLTSQQQLMHETLLPSTDIHKSGMCVDGLNIKSQAKTMEESFSTLRKDKCDDSNIPQRMTGDQNEVATLAKNVKTQRRSSQLSQSSKVLHDKKNSSVILLDTVSSIHPVTFIAKDSDSVMELEDPVPDSVNLISTKTTKVRENLWEKRTPKV